VLVLQWCDFVLSLRGWHCGSVSCIGSVIYWCYDDRFCVSKFMYCLCCWCGCHCGDMWCEIEDLESIAFCKKPTSKLQSIICHMRSHSVICHPTQVDFPLCNPSQTGCYSVYLPQKDGWVGLGVGYVTSMFSLFSDSHYPSSNHLIATRPEWNHDFTISCPMSYRYTVTDEFNMAMRCMHMHTQVLIDECLKTFYAVIA